MQTSGLFTTRSFTINHTYGKPLHLVIFGDIHRDSPNFADGAWDDFLKRGRSIASKSVFLGMGDYIDSASASERACLGNGDLHDSTKKDLEMLAKDKVKLLAKELAFMRGRLIGLVNGNHYFQFQSGMNTDQRLADALGTAYLGVCSLIRLTINCHGRKNTLDIFAHHGKGASRLIGGSLNRVAQMVEGVDADIHIMGHDHKKGAVPTTPRIYLDGLGGKSPGLVVRQREVWVVRSGSFLASYRDGEVNYNVDAGRLPSSLGHVEMLITLTANDKKNSQGGRSGDSRKIQCLV